MNTTELDEIGRRIHAVFPAVCDWFERLRPVQQDAIRSRRNAALMDLDAAFVDRAIGEFAGSHECPWGGYGQTEYVYAHVARRARAIAAERSADAECATTIERGTRRQGIAFGDPLIRASELVTRLIQARCRGECATAVETREWLDAECPATAADDNDPREWARCATCRDSGLVTVVSVLTQRPHGLTWTTAAAACRCESGRAFRERRDEKSRLPEYDDQKHVRVISFATATDILAESSRVRERYAQRNRVDDFDAFNDRGAM